MIVLYTEYAEKFRLLAVYTESYSLERRFKFVPIERPNASLDSLVEYFKKNPIFFGSVVKSPLNLNDPNKLKLLAKKIHEAIENNSDETVILYLTRGR